MKRFSNSIFYAVLVPEILYSLFLWFSGERFFFTYYFFIVCFVLILSAYLINVVDRYSAMMVFGKKKAKYAFVSDAPLGKEPLRWSAMTFGVGIPFAFLIGGFFIYALPDTFYSGMVLLFSGIEKLVFVLYSRRNKLFRAGLSSQALIINNGGLTVIPLGGLKGIESKYDELLFIYGENDIRSTYRFLVEEQEQEKFFLQLEKLTSGMNIPVQIKRS